MKGNILILDDNKSVLTALEMLIQTEFDQVFPLSNPNLLLATLQKHRIDVVLLDMNFKAGINTGNEGIFWLHQIQKHDPTIVVVMITAFGDVELAVKAVKEGAFDFILKPWDNRKLISTLHAAMKLRKSQMDNTALAKTSQTLKQALAPPFQEFIGQSEPTKKVMAIVKKVAATDANIFITGENGTGKELIAREIHQHSLRKNEIMLSVDMGAISETLFDSELFGHTKGSFTDAKEERNGKFEAAHKGSLFLDEIGNLPLSLQAKLLAVLQNRTIVKLGSNKPIPVDIRLITATNKDLRAMVAEGLFREDLLYRINTITIELPPLRERGEDVLLLAEYYLQKYATKYNKAGIKLSHKAAQKLLKHQWPGNVRELQHSIEKAVILADSAVLHEESFALHSPRKSTVSHLPQKTIEEMEKEMIRLAIEKENGNMSAVAKTLGISRPTLYKKLKSLEK
jgi:DNA-binding NtrC family response regulator